MRCVSPLSIKDPRQKRGSIRITVPCGQCGACKYNRRADWSYRLGEEERNSKNASFLTLTYDEENITENELGIQTLVKKDLQLFIKRIRKQNAQLWNEKLVYYNVGEYGPKTQRPHYHSIMFNLNRNLWPFIEGTWGKGNTKRLPLNGGSIHYCTKYHMNFDKEYSENLRREPEFAMMSNGIGKQYMVRATDWNRNNGNLYVINNGFKQRMPRYYKERIFEDWERELLGEDAADAAHKAYEKEYNRLKSQGYEDPDMEMEERAYNEALGVLKKSKEGVTI